MGSFLTDCGNECRGICNPSSGNCDCKWYQSGTNCDDPNSQAFGALSGGMVGGLLIAILALVAFLIGRIIYIKVIKPRMRLANKIFKNKRMKDPLQQQLLLHQIDAFTVNNYGGNTSEMHKQVFNIQQKLNPYDWLIKSDEVQIIKRIGSGSYGVVYYGKLRGATEIAIKVTNSSFDPSVTSSSSSSDEMNQILEEFSRELTIWSSLKHPNIVLFIGACIDPTNSSILIVSEFMHNGTLNDIFQKKKISLDWKTKLKITSQIASAMSYLHSRSPPLLHRDLKGANILLSKEMVAKVGDFGMAKIMASKDVAETHTIAGTPYWMSPEVIKGERYGAAADVYSFAIIMWQILAEKPNPYEEDIFKVQYKVVQGARPCIPLLQDSLEFHLNKSGQKFRSKKEKNVQISQEFKPLMPLDDSEALEKSIGKYIDLMQVCWDQDPKNRPSFREITTKIEELD